MQSQSLFIPAAWAKGRQSARARALAEFDRAIDWSALEVIAKPHYDERPGPRGGRPKHPLRRMIRLLFLARLYRLPDDAVEDAVADSRSFMRFIGFDGWESRVPSGESLRQFRGRLEQAGADVHFDAVFIGGVAKAGLQLLRPGTIVEPAIRRRSAKGCHAEPSK